MTTAPTLVIDADACPVKEEVYRVGSRTGCPVVVVANSFIRTPPGVRFITVDAGPDAADDWIVDAAQAFDIVITQDIPLASRALAKGAFVISPKGEPFTPASIGAALAGREIMEHLRSMGEGLSGPKPFSPQDRSRFLNALDAALTQAKARRKA
jgi:uncharacterized protein YaiI (UPF0178 family)